MEITEIIEILSERDSKKRVTILKLFIELSLIISYSILSYKLLFGTPTIINKFYELTFLYDYFLSGKIFIPVFLFVFWFLMVKHVSYYILYYLDVFISSLIKKKFLKEFNIMNVLTVYKIIYIDENKKHIKGKRFDLIYKSLKYIYNESREEISEKIFRNISLIIHFLCFLIMYVLPHINSNYFIKTLITLMLLFIFVVQTYSFLLIETLNDFGYNIIEIMSGFNNNINNNVSSNSFNPDKPIKSIGENKLLKRDYYSEILKDSIKNYKDKDSIVIGIDGEWGDGKTSFINMSIEEFIYNINEKKHVLFFNPWNYGSTNDIILSFLIDLKSFFRKILGKNYTQYFNNTLLSYIQLLTEQKNLILDNVSDENDLGTLKKEINRVLIENDFKLIVVIDDIDRLTKNEVKLIFQFVKLIGDFPNIIYIIPFDKQKVIKECDFDEDYIRKIIQIEIKLPPVTQLEINKILNERIKSILNSDDSKRFNFDDWNVSFNQYLKFYIKNLRDINRLINTIKFYLNVEQVKDINLNDFFILTSIQIFDIRLYNFIGSNKTTFTFYYNDRLYEDFDHEHKKQRTMKLLESSKDIFNIKGEGFDNLIYSLFPNFQFLIKNNFIYTDNIYAFRNDLRLCTKEYFDKYFLYPLEKDKLSKSEFEELINSSKDKSVFYKKINELIIDDKFDFFLNKFIDYLFLLKNEMNRGNIIETLLSFKKSHKLKFNPELDNKIIFVIDKTFDEIEEKERIHLYKRVIVNKKYDINSVTQLTGSILRSHGYSVGGNLSEISGILKQSHNKEHHLYILCSLIRKRYRRSINEIMYSESPLKFLDIWKSIDPDNKHVSYSYKRFINYSDMHFITFFNNIISYKYVVDRTLTSPDRLPYYDLQKIMEVIDFNYIYNKVNSVLPQTNIDDVSLMIEWVKYNINRELFLKEYRELSNNQDPTSKLL